MTVDELQALRRNLKVTQVIMADAMGMPLRSYQDIEGGKNPIRPVHVLAAERATIRLAITQNQPSAVPEGLRQEVLALANILNGGDPGVFG